MDTNNYVTLHGLEVTYFAAMGYEYREGWAGGEETDEWWHEGKMVYSSAMGHIFSAQRLLALIKKHKVNIEFVDNGIKSTIGETQYCMGTIEESVLFTLILHLWEKNKTKDRISIVQLPNDKIKMKFDGIEVTECSISLALMAYYEVKQKQSKENGK